jgi:hypothetical protein
MRKKRVLKLLQTVVEAVVLGLASGAAKAGGLLLFTYLFGK